MTEHTSTFLSSDTMTGVEPVVLVIQPNEQPRNGCITASTYTYEALNIVAFLRSVFSCETIRAIKEELR